MEIRDSLTFLSQRNEFLLFFITPLYNWIISSLQAAFYLFTVGGRMLEKVNAGWLRILCVPMLLFNSNLAAFMGKDPKAKIRWRKFRLMEFRILF